MQLLLCYDNEGVYVNTVGRVSKNIVLQVSKLKLLAVARAGLIMDYLDPSLAFKYINKMVNSLLHLKTFVDI